MKFQVGDKVFANISTGEVEGVVVDTREVYTWWRGEHAILINLGEGFSEPKFIGFSQLRLIPAAPAFMELFT